MESFDLLYCYAQEIVLLDFNHLYAMDEDEHHFQLLDMVYETLGDKVAHREEHKINHKSPVGEYWEHGAQAVVLYKQHSIVKDRYEGKVWPMWMIQSKWPNTGDTEVLHERLAEYVETRDEKKFFVLQGILTPDTESIKNNLLDGDGISIKTTANRCSPKVVEWCEEEWNNQALNIVIVDFYENCGLIPSIIHYNTK